MTVTPTTPSVAEPDSGGTATTSFTVRLSATSSQTVTVQYTTDAETATAGDDFTATSGTLTFTAGETVKSVSVAVRGDALDEDDETFSLRLTAATRATIATATARKTILDNDPLPSFGVADPVAATEGSGSGTTTVTFTVTLAPVSGRTTSVQYATQNGTAAAPGDFTAASGTLTFARGEVTKQVQVVVVRDALDEADETFSLVLSNPTNATIGDGNASATIRDDDQPPALWIESAAVTEGNSGSQVMVFSVRLCPPGTGAGGCAADAAVSSGLQASAAFATADWTASAPSDYATAAGVLTIPAGGKSGTVGITVKGDVSFERDEEFTVALSAPVNITLARTAAIGTIRNDDQPPEVSLSDVTIVEGGVARFDITLCVPGTSNLSPGCTPVTAGLPISANYAVASGTECAHASPPAFQIVDFEHVGGQRVVLPGSTGTSLSVQTFPDRVAEGTEHFCVGLAIPEGGEGVLGRRTGVGVIQDDDLAPTVAIGNAQVTEGDDGTVLASFTVTFSNPTELCAPDGDFCGASVQWVTVPGSAAAPSDFAQTGGLVVMSPPDPNTFAVQLTHRIEVAVAGDTIDEDEERFTVALLTPRNASISATGGVGAAVITDDDAPPAVTTSSASAVTPASATLHGVADTSQKPTTVWFEYGPTGDYGLSTAPLNLPAGGPGQPVAAAVSGLALGTLYHYRAVARNATGTAYGSRQTFVTGVPAPLAETLAASDVGASTASVAGLLTTHARETGYWFEFGPTTAYGSSTPARSLTSPASQTVTEQLTGLSPGTAYHYRLVARRDGSLVEGADHTFRTAQLVTRSRFLPAVSLLTTTATLTRTIIVAKLRCVRAQGRCRGVLTLDASRRALSSSGGGRVVIGGSRTPARSGKTATVTVRLSAPARNALIRSRRLGALALVTLRDDAGAGPARRVSMTLLMPSKRRR